MGITVDTKSVQAGMERFVRQIPFATSKALNDTAYAAQKAVTNMLRMTIDRPTPFTLRSIAVDKATKTDLSARVFLKTDSPSKGSSYVDVLGHHFLGGARPRKKSEYALANKGQFQGGKGFLGVGSAAQTDAYGNIPNATIVMLMSYFNAFKENGYRANATDRSRRKRAKYGKSGAVKIGPPTSLYKAINGVVYFMSRGKGHFVGQGKGWSGGRNQPLAAGIYSKTGTHGVDVQPVLTAIRKPNYRKLIDMRRVVSEVIQRDFRGNYNAAIQMAMRTAR